MHLFHILQCSIQNNVHISVLKGALWDMEQVQSGICELRQFAVISSTVSTLRRDLCYFKVLQMYTPYM